MDKLNDLIEKNLVFESFFCDTTFYVSVDAHRSSTLGYFDYYEATAYDDEGNKYRALFKIKDYILEAQDLIRYVWCRTKENTVYKRLGEADKKVTKALNALSQGIYEDH